MFIVPLVFRHTANMQCKNYLVLVNTVIVVLMNIADPSVDGITQQLMFL